MVQVARPKAEAGKLLHAVPGSRRAPDSTQLSKQLDRGGGLPPPLPGPRPNPRQLLLSRLRSPCAFFKFGGKQERGFGGWGFRQVTVATRAVVRVDVSVHLSPSFPADLIGGKIPLD